MNVTVNGDEMEIGEGTTAASLLTLLELDDSACAVEINEMLVTYKSRDHHEIEHGDVIEIVTLTGGG